jgi:hypothetical protein
LLLPEKDDRRTSSHLHVKTPERRAISSYSAMIGFCQVIFIDASQSVIGKKSFLMMRICLLGPTRSLKVPGADDLWGLGQPREYFSVEGVVDQMRHDSF